MEGGDEEGDWNDVVNKKNNRSNRNSDGRISKGPVTKFFVSNLPLGCNPWDVADFVKVFGEVTGVYIARKLDKQGRRFGFVSFVNVPDVKDMERALNGTKMGGYKLVANLAKFAKENDGILGRKDKGMDDNKKEPSAHVLGNKIHNQAFFKQGTGKLFSDLFRKDQYIDGNKDNSNLEPSITIELADDTLAFKDPVGLALVGRCKDLKVLRNLNTILADYDTVGVSLSYLGGLDMLIKFEVEENCVNFLLDNQKWKEWFSSLDHWEGQALPFERLAWVKIQGVPIQLADNDVLNNIAEHFGKVVHGSKMEAEDENLSVSWIGLLVGEGGRIREHVTLKCKNKSYRVWIEEEITDLTPDSVGSVVLPSDKSSCLEMLGTEERNKENISVSVSEGNVGNPKVTQQEDQELANINLRSDDVNVDSILGNENGVHGNNGLGSSLSGTCVRDEVGNISNPCGPIMSNAAKNIVYFTSVEKDNRKKRRTYKIKPRSKAQLSSGKSSPGSGDRPKKRSRDNGTFTFDLNLASNDVHSHCPAPDNPGSQEVIADSGG
ncbi:putative RNA recognition motif domain, nucleotide-binding alpha-beta plait domain superfamily [Helianthus debilis subsp. tardiflorus]